MSSFDVLFQRAKNNDEKLKLDVTLENKGIVDVISVNISYVTKDRKMHRCGGIKDENKELELVFDEIASEILKKFV